MEWKLVGMLPTSSVVTEINNSNCKGHVNIKPNEEMNSGDTRNAEANLDSFKLKRLERVNTEEPLEVKIYGFIRHATTRR